MSKKLCLIITSLYGVVFSLASCYEGSGPERDVISFKDPVPMVEDSLKAMRDLMEKLPEAHIKNYMILDDNILKVNSKELGDLEQLQGNELLDTVSVFHNFSKQEAQQFVRIALYLRENYIDYSYAEPLLKGGYLFNYRQLKSNDSKLSRGVMIVESSNDTLQPGFNAIKQVIDRKGNLVLVAPKDGW